MGVPPTPHTPTEVVRVVHLVVGMRSLWPARGGTAQQAGHAKEANSGDFLPPSPPAEKATAR
jgi:hypothetical protein